MKKTKFQRFLYGVHLGIKLSLLPDPVSKFHNYLWVRILRVLGGLCILLILSGAEWIKNSILFYLVFPLAVLHFIYIITISIIKLCYYIYLLWNKELKVSNSPLDRIASFGLNLVACVKGTCQYGIGTGAALGLGLSIDELLERCGREAVFKHTLGKGLDQALNSIGIENTNKDIYKLDDDIKILKYKYKKLIELNKDVDSINSLGDETGIKDSELIKEVKKDINRRIEEEKASISKHNSKILSELGKNSK